MKDGVVEAGMVGYRFNTIGVSDGISMGTSGQTKLDWYSSIRLRQQNEHVDTASSLLETGKG